MNLLVSLALLCFGAEVVETTSIAEGKAVLTCRIGEHDLNVFTYRPANYSAESGPLIVVFHGQGRNADDYRDHGIPLANRIGGLVVAPEFDADRFPIPAYNYGNMFDQGQPRAEEQWTFSMVPRLIDEIRRREGRADMPYYLIGHSAGGQFVERLLAFVDMQPLGAVAANPGSHLFPTRELPFPYGFAELPGRLGDDAILQRYLAVPLTIYVGTADADPEAPLLDRSNLALRQGPHRLARGRACYAAAMQLAADRGWTCNWQLAEAPDVAHSARDMFRHANAVPALFRQPASQ